MISLVRIDGSTKCLAFDGALDRKMSYAYMKDVLLPVLHSGDIVVLDNLSSHKDKIITDYFAQHKRRILFLPAYSPDLNPIEKMWSKVKAILREKAATTRESFFETIDAAFKQISPKNIQGWFKSCGHSQS
jgi:transposase